MNVANDIKCRLHNYGIESYIEFSGYRGYHVWVFFDEWISTRYVNLLQDLVIFQKEKQVKELSIECFPNKTRVKGKQLGQAIKLPWGKHYISGKRSYFLDDNMMPLVKQKDILENITRYKLNTIKRVVANNTKEQFSTVNSVVSDISISFRASLSAVLSSGNNISS